MFKKNLETHTVHMHCVFVSLKHVCDRGKPKKGRGGPREAKRIRVTSEQDFDYEDDPDLTL